MNFAEPLKKAPFQKGLSQAALAGRLGIPQPNLSAYESGLREPALATVRRVLDFFSTTWEDFFADQPLGKNRFEPDQLAPDLVAGKRPKDTGQNSPFQH